MKIFLAVISVALLASVVQANFMLGVLPAIYQCGQKHSGKLTIGNVIVISEIFDKLGEKCAINPNANIGELLLCTGTKIMGLIAELEKALSTNPDTKALTAPSSTVLELLSALLDVENVPLCVVKHVTCSGMQAIPAIGEKLCTTLSILTIGME